MASLGRTAVVLMLAHAALGSEDARARSPLPAERLLILDQDHLGGSLLTIDLAQPAGAAPARENIMAPPGPIVGLALSPFDGRAYVTDVDADGNGAGAIHAIDGATGRLQLIALTGPALDQPASLDFLPDGRLVVANLDLPSDPPSVPGVYVVDLAAGAIALLSDGTLHSAMAGYPSGTSAFKEPAGIAYSEGDAHLYVADTQADPLGRGYTGAVYRIDVTTGEVELVASMPGFLTLRDIAARPDGMLVACDAGRSLPAIWEIDPQATDPSAASVVLTRDDRFEMLLDVAVDSAGRVFVADGGRFNGTTRTWEVMPRVFRIDESVGDPARNGVVVSDSGVLANILSIVEVPAFRVESVSPNSFPPRSPDCPPPLIRVDGQGLVPGLAFDLGPDAPVISRTALESADGSAVALGLRPSPAFAGVLDLTASHPFGGSARLAGAVTFAGGAPPGIGVPPCSTKGDATCDGIVDGLDLAALGRAFGSERCDPLRFDNDADFDDDDLVDGRDLSVLAAYFGARP